MYIVALRWYFSNNNMDCFLFARFVSLYIRWKVIVIKHIFSCEQIKSKKTFLHFPHTLQLYLHKYISMPVYLFISFITYNTSGISFSVQEGVRTQMILYCNDFPYQQSIMPIYLRRSSFLHPFTCPSVCCIYWIHITQLLNTLI